MSIEATEYQPSRANTKFIAWSSLSNGKISEQAISREKELKRWVRRRKFQLIESVTPAGNDLSLEWLPEN
jgi:predicted GIY-YIG superfamily endonuclease